MTTQFIINGICGIMAMIGKTIYQLKARFLLLFSAKQMHNKNYLNKCRCQDYKI